MMFGVVRRSVASRGYPALILKITRPSASAYRICSTFGKEVLLHPKGPGHVKNLCRHIFPGCSVSLKPIREVASCFHPEAAMQMQSRHISSENGDLVDAVVPFMGESISDGTLAKFLKNPGDSVQVDEPIAQIETDKVTIDVASPEAGVIQKLVAKEGDVVEPGTKVAVISKSGEGVTRVASSKKKSGEAAAKPPPAAEIKNEKQKLKLK